MSKGASEPLVVDLDELNEVLERARAAPLCDEDHDKLALALHLLATVRHELDHKRASIERLRKMLFGASTEKTSKVTGHRRTGDAAGGEDGAPGQRRKRKGHGRNSAAAYTGAQHVEVPHESLAAKQCCPACRAGKLYDHRPQLQVHLKGNVPVTGELLCIQQLRCNLCGQVFTAKAPPGAADKKYDESVGVVIALHKYGAGTPFNRIEKLQAGAGIPLPASTQWDLVHGLAKGSCGDAFAELVRQGAQGDVVHNDDTGAKILELMGKAAAEDEKEDEPGDEGDERSGIFTSAIVSTTLEGRRIALFFTGRQHAGENLADLLTERAAELRAPIQMCDALSRNLPKAFATILANCMAHGRRRFVDVHSRFPEECGHVLEVLRDVYRYDELAREEGMSAEQRLCFHQEHSKPLIDGLKKWLRRQLDDKLVEPNSSLGDAIQYMLDHWEPLTLFLRQAGAPLDNNICERALKKAILHRKNSYFYKTQNGAWVGDVFMSLIHTAELCRVSPLDYLLALARHPAQVRVSPADWMPWTYQETLARLAVPSAAA